jgi:lycopene beta-cyclase
VDYDVLIAGGGLSGLSLAAHLAAGGWRDRSVLVVDDPTAQPSAVSWGSWAARPRLLDRAVSREFGQVRIHAGGVETVVPLGEYRYQVVRRVDLRRVVQDLLANCPAYTLASGHVESVHNGGAVVDGRLVRASWVFTSVDRPHTTVDARLAFTGWEVSFDRPVFDPNIPTLFDFRVAQGQGARFVYVLPGDAYRALVELTEFVPRHAEPPTEQARQDGLAEYLDRYPGPYVRRREESAVLPLSVRSPDRGTGRVLPIGASAGLIKASTGYAYQRIQHDSAAIATSLARHGHPYDLPRRPWRFRLLDAVLLDVLDRDPAQLELAFARLFARNPAGRVLRFLDEEPYLPAELRLMASLSPGPYLRGLARYFRCRTRRLRNSVRGPASHDQGSS